MQTLLGMVRRAGEPGLLLVESFLDRGGRSELTESGEPAAS
jgi:hypothetical protein